MSSSLRHGCSCRFVEGEMSMCDAMAAARLFHMCVHETNSADYTASQLDAWSPGDKDSLRDLAQRLCGNYAVIALVDADMAAFGTVLFDESCEAELDMLYVAPSMQGTGIGARIVEELEREAWGRKRSSMRSYVSLTARSFFEKRGYGIVRDNVAVRRGVELPNFLMSKLLH